MPFDLLPTNILQTHAHATNLVSSMKSKLPSNPAIASLYYRNISEIQSALTGLTEMLNGAFGDLRRSPMDGMMWALAKSLIDGVVDMLEELDHALDRVVEADKEVREQVGEVAGIVRSWRRRQR